MPLNQRVHGLKIALLVAIHHHIGNVLDRLANQKQKPGCPVVKYGPVRLQGYTLGACVWDEGF